MAHRRSRSPGRHQKDAPEQEVDLEDNDDIFELDDDEFVIDDSELIRVVQHHSARIEDVRLYTDDRLIGEVKELLQLDLRQYFARRSYYERRLRSIVRGLRAVSQQYSPDALYGPSTAMARPLVEMESVVMVDGEGEGREVPGPGCRHETLRAFLHERNVVQRTCDVPVDKERRLAKLSRPHTLPPDADPAWIVTLPRDADCALVGAAPRTPRNVRLLGPTVWANVRVDEGDPVLLRGIHIAGAVTEEQEEQVFNLDAYLDHLSNLAEGERVTLLFNDGRKPAKARVSKLGSNSMTLILNDGGAGVELSVTHPEINSAFAYGAAYTGPRFCRAALAAADAKPWLFTLSDRTAPLDSLMRWVVPTVGEALGARKLDVCSPASMERALGISKLGAEGAQRALAMVNGNTRTVVSAMKPGKNKKAFAAAPAPVAQDVTPNVPDFLQFFRHRRTLERYYNAYVGSSTKDSDRLRFAHVFRSLPRLYAYCLDLLLHSAALEPGAEQQWQKRSKLLNQKRKQKEHKDAHQQVVPVLEASSVPNLAVLVADVAAGTRTVKDGEKVTVAAYPGHPARTYEARNGIWYPAASTEPVGAAVLPDAVVPFNPELAEAATQARTTAEQNEIIQDALRDGVTTFRNRTIRAIADHLALEPSGMLYRPRQMHATGGLDLTDYVGDADADVADFVPENIDAVQAAQEPEVGEAAIEASERLGRELLSEPVGAVLALIVELFRIDLPSEELRAAFHTVSRSREFEHHRAELREKESRLRRQALQFRDRAKGAARQLTAAQIEATVRDRLAADKDAFLTTFYGKAVAMVLAHIAVLVQARLPAAVAAPATGAGRATFSLRGYPVDASAGPSLIGYMAAVLSRLGGTMAREAPLARAVRHHGDEEGVALAAAARAYVAKLLEDKPHLGARIQRARAALEGAAQEVEQGSTMPMFEGFRPRPVLSTGLTSRLPQVKPKDLLLVDGVTGAAKRVNRCCPQRLTNVDREQQQAGATVVAAAGTVTQHIMILRHGKIQRDRAPDVAVIHNRVAQVPVSIAVASSSMQSNMHDQRLGQVMERFASANVRFYAGDELFMRICRAPADTAAWAALSVQVSMGWQALFSSARVSDVDKPALASLFISHDGYADAYELRRAFLQLASSVLPGILGRAASGRVPQMLHVERKRWLHPAQRRRLTEGALDEETRYVLDLLHTRPAYAPALKQAFADIVSGALQDALSLEASGCPPAGIHRNVLAINYVILKAFVLLLHAAAPGGTLPAHGCNVQTLFDRSRFEAAYVSSSDTRGVAEFIRLLLSRAAKTAQATHVDLEEVRHKFEVQREHVKLDIQQKMERLTTEERGAFRLLRDRMGFTHEYLDPFQAATALLADAAVLNAEEEMRANSARAEEGIAAARAMREDEENHAMAWVGENPDDVELEDDGAGY